MALYEASWLEMQARAHRSSVTLPLGGAGRGWRHRTQPRHNCTPQLSLTAPASRINWCKLKNRVTFCQDRAVWSDRVGDIMTEL